MSDNAQAQVSGPGIGLMVCGGLGLLGQLLGLLVRIGLLGITLPGMGGGNTPGAALMVGAIGMVLTIIGIVVNLVVLFGGMKMKGLQSYGLAMTAAILAVIPCFSPCPCCFLSLGIGIWAIIVLVKPEVKAAFQG